MSAHPPPAGSWFRFFCIKSTCRYRAHQSFGHRKIGQLPVKLYCILDFAERTLIATESMKIESNSSRGVPGGISCAVAIAVISAIAASEIMACAFRESSRYRSSGYRWSSASRTRRLVAWGLEAPGQRPEFCGVGLRQWVEGVC